jgi:uncharacterized protein YuzE
MKVTYDSAADAAYIYLTPRLKPGGVKRTYSCETEEVGGMINLDFDEAGALLGIEVLDASRLLPADVVQAAERIG